MPGRRALLLALMAVALTQSQCIPARAPTLTRVDATGWRIEDAGPIVVEIEEFDSGGRAAVWLTTDKRMIPDGAGGYMKLPYHDEFWLLSARGG